MNSSKNDHYRINFMEKNEKSYNAMDLNRISKAILQKINNMKTMDDDFIDEICNGLKLYCENHNKMINDWFDDNYMDDLKIFKANNKKYSELENSFDFNSFISVPNY